jgi:hypothetical protein
MAGNDEVRFCSHCSKHVHNLSKMTRRRAEELVARTQGQLCVRFERRDDRSIVTCEPVFSVRRRASRWTGAAFAAFVGLFTATASAQDAKDKAPSCPNGSKMVFKRQRSPLADDGTSYALLSGTVTDANGAVIIGVKVTLTNERTKSKSVVVTNDEGVYNFPSLMPDTYKLTLEHIGFETITVEKIVAEKQDEMSVDVTMPVKELRDDVDVKAGVISNDGTTIGIVSFMVETTHTNLLPMSERPSTKNNNAVRDNR